MPFVYAMPALTADDEVICVNFQCNPGWMVGFHSTLVEGYPEFVLPKCRLFKVWDNGTFEEIFLKNNDDDDQDQEELPAGDWPSYRAYFPVHDYKPLSLRDTLSRVCISEAEASKKLRPYEAVAEKCMFLQAEF